MAPECGASILPAYLYFLSVESATQYTELLSLICFKVVFKLHLHREILCLRKQIYAQSTAVFQPSVRRLLLFVCCRFWIIFMIVWRFEISPLPFQNYICDFSDIVIVCMGTTESMHPWGSRLPAETSKARTLWTWSGLYQRREVGESMLDFSIPLRIIAAFLNWKAVFYFA